MSELKLKLFGNNCGEQKKAFIITIILALTTHLYAFTNVIINHDCVNSILNRESTEHYIELGRWAIIPFLKISSSSVLPMVIGTLSVLYLGIAALLLVVILDLHSNASIILNGALISTFPVLVNTFCYMYTADAYIAAFTLAILYVYLIRKGTKYTFFSGIFLMTVVCGIYQAYWCFGAVLLLTVCFIDYLRGKLDFNNFFKNAFLYILNLVLSLGLYYIITILIHKVTGISFSSYQDMDKIGKFNSVKEIYWYAREAYYQFLKFFFINGGFVSDKRQVILNIIIAVIVLILMTSCFYSKKRRWYESGFFYIVLLLIPLAVNVLSVISRNRLWPVMMIAFIIPYMLAILCCEHMVFLKCVWLRKSIVFICCISIGITAYMNYLTTNRIYLRMDLAYEATYAYLVKLTMRLEDCPDYQHDMPVSFINESDIIEKNQLNQIRFFEVDYPEEMSVFDDLNGMRDVDARTMIRNELDIVDFCQAFLGFKLVIIPNEERLKLYENREVQRMPVYPTEGSIKKINNQIVVKLPG